MGFALITSHNIIFSSFVRSKSEVLIQLASFQIFVYCNLNDTNNTTKSIYENEIFEFRSVHLIRNQMYAKVTTCGISQISRMSEVLE